jgi:hypothetical protein
MGVWWQELQSVEAGGRGFAIGNARNNPDVLFLGARPELETGKYRSQITRPVLD